MRADRVFISYSRADSRFALKLAEDLQRTGLNIWIDQSGLRPSEPWDKGIENALETSAYFVVILSPSAISSSNVLNEINFAIEEKKPVIPVIISHNIKKPLNITRLQHIDFTGLYDQGFNQLIETLGKENKSIAKNKTSPRPSLWIASLFAIIITAIAIIKFAFSTNNMNNSLETKKEKNYAEGPNVVIGGYAKNLEKQYDESFAKKIMEFGSKGIGPGLFTNASYISVDGKGRIYVAELDGTRVQQFDSDGRFIKQWRVKEKSCNLRGIASDRTGNIYVIHSDGIYKYNGETGNFLGKTINGYFNKIKIAPDDGLAVVDNNENIICLNSEGEMILTIHDAIRSHSGDRITDIAIDGLGNIYALSRSDCSVFKFSPEGKFLTRFGSEGRDPGQFFSPHGIAIDGLGRVYVSDIRIVRVFDSTGRYLTSFKVIVSLDMIFNDNNELLIVTGSPLGEQVVKFKIRK